MDSVVGMDDLAGFRSAVTDGQVQSIIDKGAVLAGVRGPRLVVELACAPGWDSGCESEPF